MQSVYKTNVLGSLSQLLVFVFCFIADCKINFGLFFFFLINVIKMLCESGECQQLKQFNIVIIKNAVLQCSQHWFT